MALFKRDAEPSVAQLSRAPAREERARASTVIAAGTCVEGKVSGATDLLVEGEIEGEVEVDAAVVVSATGRVHGRIAAHLVRVAGSVEGNVVGRDRVELQPTARLHGDVAAAKVVIAEGAFLEGSVEMRGSDPSPAAPARD